MKKRIASIMVLLWAVFGAGCYDSIDQGLHLSKSGVGLQQLTGGNGPAAEDRATVAVPLPQPKKKWTVLVYLDADNNLSEYSIADVKEMMKAGSDANYNIILLWDNDPSQEGSGSQNKHGYYYVHPARYTLLKDIGEVNMGDANTATGFIDFAVKNFPAEHYCWIYWNHGGAVDRANRGVCWDDTNGGDHLSEVQQKNIMAYFKKKIGRAIDIVGFDACLMATAELVYQYKDYAQYLVASEQTIAGNGWDYTFLKEIRATPSMSAKSLCTKILAYYKKYYTSSEPTDDATLSVFYLKYADAFAASLNNFSVASLYSGVSKSVFVQCAKGMDMFGSSGSSYYTKDLYAYCAKVAASGFMPQTVKDSALDVMSKIADKKFIVSEWHGGAWGSRVHGVSITLKYATAIYKKLDICTATKWDEFLNWAGFPNSDAVH